ncbi:octopamine receptor beta-2R-like [Montipora capricornis]|uniref:octopamine receptor beta-2R-like n=1 Tax=Montipora capricornis TaxID=246305 RepID=UPI0035F1F433
MNTSNSSLSVNESIYLVTGYPLPTSGAQKWHEVMYAFLYLAEIGITVAALVGNFIVVYAFVFYRKLRTSVTNYFVISLAVSDILTTGFVTSFHLDASTKAHLWTHGEFMCSLYTTMYLLAVPSSIINLCAVTVDRYLVLKMPLRYNTLMTPGRAVFIICWLWVYAVIWACLPVMGWKIDLPAVEDGYCYFLSTRDYNVTVNIVNFVLPMIFMAIFWSLIYGIVSRHIQRVIEIENNISLNTNESTNSSNCTTLSNLIGASDPAPPRNEKREKKRMRRIVRGSRYIGLIVLLFYLCWFPFVTISLIGNLCDEVEIPFILYDVFLTMGFMNSALNPFLYPFHDKHFKEAFRSMWRKLKTKILFKLNPC